MNNTVLSRPPRPFTASPRRHVYYLRPPYPPVNRHFPICDYLWTQNKSLLINNLQPQPGRFTCQQKRTIRTARLTF